LKQELEVAYEQHDQKARKADGQARKADQQARETDQQDEERFGERDANRVEADIRDVERRLAQVNAALEQVEQQEADGKPTVPKRLRRTDPDSRIMPSKIGGHAPNYTRATTVDIGSGMIIDSTVLHVVNEHSELLNAVDRVQENFDLKSPPEQLLADGLMATGENLRNRPEISSRFVKREHRQPRVRDRVKTRNASVVAARRAL
jgi:hypothetical protein